ncbi:MAG: hypothetical protein ACRDD7_03585, partial [Peptostreptococcaceae bacterium]
MRDLILDGRLYLSLPPLYKIKDSKNQFVTDKEQYQSVFFRRITDKFILKTTKGKPLNKKEILEFLHLNKYYLDELQRCADHYSVNKSLIEFVIKYKDDKNFKKDMKKKFPEIAIEADTDNKEDLVVKGVYEGAFQIFTIDKVFEKKTRDIKDLMDKNEYQYYEVIETYSGGEEVRGEMSIGEFLVLSQKLQPVIELRYKGLGELSEDDLWDTVMNPETRTLVQLTVNDIQEAIAMYDRLHGNSKSNIQDR